jgi:putative methanogenesis marker protein 3
MLVKINGEDIDIPEGSTIEDAINITNAPYSQGSIICLIKGQSELEGNINKYKIKSPKGSVIIELSDTPEAKPLVDFWKAHFTDFNGLNVRWAGNSDVAVGPVTTDFKPSKENHQYRDRDVLLSLSGFSRDATHIIFAKDDMENVYGVPEGTGNGVFAKVIGGFRTLRDLTDDDNITTIEPIIERSTVTDSSSISELSTELEEGNQLFTYCLIEPNRNSPKSVEQFFSVIYDNKIKVDYDSNSFVGEFWLQGITKPVEEITERERGTVTLRNTGKGKGKIYIYREDRVRVASHTTIGKVIKGMELIDTAKYGDVITVHSNPEPIKTLTKTQKEAEEELKALGIKQERTGVVDDNAIVVEQEPASTIEVLEKGAVQTKGLNKEDLVLIKMVDNAPRTRWYFDKLTDLVEKPIGKLTVYFAVKDMHIYMFNGDDKESKGILPENTPKGTVKAGSIGVTNMSRKNLGIIGIRTEDNDEFGPTAEPFDGTNIIGEVVSDLNAIKNLKDGDTVYIKEVNPEHIDEEILEEDYDNEEFPQDSDMMDNSIEKALKN